MLLNSAVAPFVVSPALFLFSVVRRMKSKVRDSDLHSCDNGPKSALSRSCNMVIAVGGSKLPTMFLDSLSGKWFIIRSIYDWIKSLRIGASSTTSRNLTYGLTRARKRLDGMGSKIQYSGDHQDKIDPTGSKREEWRRGQG